MKPALIKGNNKDFLGIKNSESKFEGFILAKNEKAYLKAHPYHSIFKILEKKQKKTGRRRRRRKPELTAANSEN